MTRQLWFGTGLLLAACAGGGSPEDAAPATSSAGAVRSFMEAVADSNLSRMASLWGTPSGSASKTNQPPDWRRRIAIMQAYLQNDSFRIVSDRPNPDENRRAQQVEIKRKTCTWSVPFVTVKGPQGWLVNQVDLAAAGNPSRPCLEPGVADSSRQG